MTASVRVRVGVLGAGYVGLVSAACLARRGHRVTVLEIEPSRLESLRQGSAPFHEPGLQQVLDQTLRDGRLIATDDPSALATCDAVLICVGTPLDRDGQADLSQVRSACATIARHSPNAPVVVRSTLPIGTANQLHEWLRRPDLGDVVINPEFLRQGSAIADFTAPTRIVIGTHDGLPNAVSDLVERMHGAPDAPVLVTDYATAEMIKNAANAFLATKLSFVNEVADLCEAYGADIDAVAEGIGLDPRIGSSYLKPGIGFGGSCLPKELANLKRLGEQRGVPVRLLSAAGAENGGRIARTCDRLERLTGGLDGRRVAQLGLSFKPHTDDLRHSPALALARSLINRGANVVAHDPAVPFGRTAGIYGLERVASPAAAIAGADLVVLATEWPDYRALDWLRLRRSVRRALLFDGRNALDERMLRAIGWHVARIGRADDLDDRSSYASGASGHSTPGWRPFPVRVGADGR
jgi:UDPglucose 6-dehydrogenase